MVSRLDDIRARLQQATPGPWVERSFDECQTIVHAAEKLPEGGQRFVATVSVGEHRPEGHQNAAFIASAPEDIAFLLALVEKQRAAIQYAVDHGGDYAPAVEPHPLKVLRAALVEGREP